MAATTIDYVRKQPQRRTAWSVALGGARDDRLAIARDPASTAEDLAAVAPGYQDPDPDLDLIAAVLDHPAVSSGVVSRYATCQDEGTRLRVARHPRCTGTALDVLAADPSAQVREAARSAAQNVDEEDAL